MSLLSEILSDDKLDELYRSGFAVIPRHDDPFELPAALIKPDWSYQWFTDGEYPRGWKAVAYQDHPGWFAPPDKEGLVAVRGARLFRKLKREVEEFHRENRHKAEKLVEDWADKFGAFTGGATMLQTNGEEVVRTNIVAGKGVEVRTESFERPATKTVELTTKIPKDMLAYIDQIFAERDRIVGELLVEEDGRSRWRYGAAPEYQPIAHEFLAAVSIDKGAPWWPTLHAIILPFAIKNVRKAVLQPNQQEAESTS